MSSEHGIGARNRAGNLEITDTNWDSNGTLRVTVRDLYGPRAFRDKGRGDAPIAAMRRLARRALHEHYAGQTRSSRVVSMTNSGGSFQATFAVTRNEG